jgi:hypothetical protein
MRDKDLELFMELSHAPKATQVEQVPIHVIIPAFVLSELRIAFQIGFLLYIPFPHRRHGRRECLDVHGHDVCLPPVMIFAAVQN